MGMRFKHDTFFTRDQRPATEGYKAVMYIVQTVGKSRKQDLGAAAKKTTTYPRRSNARSSSLAQNPLVSCRTPGEEEK